LDGRRRLRSVAISPAFYHLPWRRA